MYTDSFMNVATRTVVCALFGLALSSCTQEEWPTQKMAATPISNVTATSVNPAEIQISWTLTEESAGNDRIGVLATYFDPIRNVPMQAMAKGTQTTMVIPNTAKVAGEYTFEVNSISSTGEKGQTYTVKATSLPMVKTYTPANFKDLKLTLDMVSTNAQEASEGPISNLVDGDVNNYFHTDWHFAWSELHYIQVDLGDSSKGGKYLRFGFVPRPGRGSTSPRTVRIQTSADGNTWTTVAETSYRVPAMTGDRVDGNHFLMPEGARYIRFIPLERHDGVKLEEMLGQAGESFFNIGELYLSQSTAFDIYDPEEEIKAQIETHKSDNK